MRFGTELFKGFMRFLCFLGFFLWIWVAIETAGESVGDLWLICDIGTVMVIIGAWLGWIDFNEP